jgi:signal transduction histidine kinase
MNGSAFREALARDLPLKIVLLLYLAIGAVYLLPILTFEQLEHLAWYYLGPLLQLVMIAAVQIGLGRSENAAGRRFWNYFTIALAIWGAGAVVEAFVPELRDAVLGSLLVDSIYASYYLSLVFATEIRPDLGMDAPPRGREEELLRGSTVSFIFALLFYFSVIPSQRNPDEYLTGRFSILLYLCLEIFFLARFAYLAGVAGSKRWRLAYGLLFAAYSSSAALLVIQFHATLAPSAIPPWVGTKWDLLWYLSSLPIVLAARVSRHAGPEAPVRKEPESVAPLVWEPMAFYAIAFPLLHLLLDSSGQLSSPSRSVQQGLVVVYFAFFGFLALVHSTFREKKRRLAERALKESERRYRQLIDSHPDAILIEQDGRLVYANATGTEELGVDPTLEERSLASLGFPPPPGVRQRLRTVVPIECRVSGPRGEVDLEVAYFEMTYMGQPACQAIARDVTVAKRQRAESERLARLASLGQFSAAMAHEIRNPLAAIVMHSFFLAERLPKDDDNLRTLADINAAVDRMQKLVGGILGFVRPVALELAEEDLTAVIDSARLDLRRQVNLSEISFAEDYRHHDATVEVDVNQLVGVFTHILANAVKAMPDGGTLKLSTSNPTPREIEVVVEDTGIGIPEEDLGRVFEPFFTRRDDGVGLGLALAERVLDQHACRYRVESRPGVGTRFILIFDLAGGEVEDLGEPGAGAARPHGAKAPC